MPPGRRVQRCDRIVNFLLLGAVSASFLNPVLVDRTPSSVLVGWSLPPTSALAIEVRVNGRFFAKTPADTSFLADHLDPDTCYNFSIRATKWSEQRFVEGSVLIDTSEIAAATLAAPAPNVAEVTARLHNLRQRLLSDSLADALLAPCPLGGFSRPEYVTGGRSGMSFRAQLGRTAHIAPAMTAVNCGLARCSPQATETLPWSSGKVGRLLTSHPGSSKKVQVTVHLHAVRPALTFADPDSTMTRLMLPLEGCRASLVPSATTPASGASAPDGCFAVACAAEAEARTFCVPSPTLAAPRPAAVVAGSGRAQDEASEWVLLINRATHGLHVPGRFEAFIRTAVAPPPVPDKRRDRAHGVLEAPALREAWVATFLAALPALEISPHFPRIYDAYVCKSLPDRFVEAGALPSASTGSAAVGVVQAAAADGPGITSAPRWATLVLQTSHTDLGEVMRGFAPGTLPVDFFVGACVHGAVRRTVRSVVPPCVSCRSSRARLPLPLLLLLRLQASLRNSFTPSVSAGTLSGSIIMGCSRSHPCGSRRCPENHPSSAGSRASACLRALVGATRCE
jgi:hypothetical protein